MISREIIEYENILRYVEKDWENVFYSVVEWLESDVSFRTSGYDIHTILWFEWLEPDVSLRTSGYIMERVSRRYGTWILGCPLQVMTSWAKLWPNSMYVQSNDLRVLMWYSWEISVDLNISLCCNCF